MAQSGIATITTSAHLRRRRREDVIKAEHPLSAVPASAENQLVAANALDTLLQLTTA